MRTPCDSVAERLALGDSLAELAAHVPACPRCRGVVELSARLGATHHAVDPGLGFSARMTVGARRRIAVRRRRRLGAGIAATALAGALAVFVVTRPAPKATPTVATDTSPAPAPVTETSDEDLAALLGLADTERSSRLSADWAHITRPLSPYRRLLALPPTSGVTP